MHKITRKELKTDEFAAEVTKTYDFVQQHRAGLIRAGIIAVVVVVLVLGGWVILQRRKASANEQLNHAVRVFYAPLAAEGPSEPGMNFADAKARYTQAEKEFETIASKYSWLKPGGMARYYLGLSRYHLGKTDQAIAELRAVGESSDQQLASLAKFALAGIYADSGKSDEAQRLYRELTARPTETVPADMSRLALADHLKKRNPAEAQKLYEELKKQGEGRTVAQVAEERLAGLKK